MGGVMYNHTNNGMTSKPQPLCLREISLSIGAKVNAFNGGIALSRPRRNSGCGAEPLTGEHGAVQVRPRPEKAADCAQRRCLLRLCKFYDHSQTWREPTRPPRQTPAPAVSQAFRQEPARGARWRQIDAQVLGGGR